ncbi:hypothetical protein ZWY2020_016703 [Hordeum vulgare]|nr:hypothetical protein ZWY2020_016703 [Hordeum vulgare]
MASPSACSRLPSGDTRAMKFIRIINIIHFQRSQHSSACQFDDSQGAAKDGLWFHAQRGKVRAADDRAAVDVSGGNGKSILCRGRG